MLQSFQMPELPRYRTCPNEEGVAKGARKWRDSPYISTPIAARPRKAFARHGTRFRVKTIRPAHLCVRGRRIIKLKYLQHVRRVEVPAFYQGSGAPCIGNPNQPLRILTGKKILLEQERFQLREASQLFWDGTCTGVITAVKETHVFPSA